MVRPFPPCSPRALPRLATPQRTTRRALARAAYALTRHGAQIILDNWLPKTDNGDVMISNMIQAGKLRA